MLFGIVKTCPCLSIFRSKYIYILFGSFKTCPSPSIFRSQQCASPQASLHHRSRSSWEKVKVNPKKAVGDFIELKGWASNTIYPGRGWNWITLRLACGIRNYLKVFSRLVVDVGAIPVACFTVGFFVILFQICWNITLLFLHIVSFLIQNYSNEVRSCWCCFQKKLFQTCSEDKRNYHLGSEFFG